MKEKNKPKWVWRLDQWFLRERSRKGVKVRKWFVADEGSLAPKKRFDTESSEVGAQRAQRKISSAVLPHDVRKVFRRENRVGRTALQLSALVSSQADHGVVREDHTELVINDYHSLVECFEDALHLAKPIGCFHDRRFFRIPLQRSFSVQEDCYMRAERAQHRIHKRTALTRQIKLNSTEIESNRRRGNATRGCSDARERRGRN